jgi:hypothetical protein
MNPGGQEQLDEQFHAWLIQARGFATKPARDMISRVRRVRRYVDEDRITDEPHAWAFVIHHTELARCSSTVRSQLKRAVLIYQQFLKCNESRRIEKS